MTAKRCAVLAGSLSLLLVSGCGTAGFTGLYNTPLPGGAELGEHPYTVMVHFQDVLDLVPQASVKVNDVAVGRIDRIELSDDNTTALVTMRVNGDVRLPANAFARLRQSSLLGEKFVELAPPPENASGRLAEGAQIPLERTNRNPQIEEVLGAVSLLLNGGGIEQMQTIVKELNKAFTGNEEEIRSLLGNVNNVVSRLDRQRGEITKALDGLNRLSANMRAQTGNINNALDGLAPGLREIEAQRGQLVGMLQSLDKLSGTATHTVEASREDLVADLHALAPTLQQLAKTGTDLPKAMAFLSTYPFPEYAMVPLKGDFVNTNVMIDLNLSDLYENFVRSSGPPIPIPGLSDSGQSGANIPLPPGGPQLPPLPIPGTQPDGGLLPGLPGGGSR
ncbi:MCE family protein [Saccharopolyspora dendranthemae]|uniref:Phospholipid/cholesterol/gamma-HCH transport system substrate-binding protein n=1 Tax=Saccharopolyspora dendranthemae TaxID=1181886 RepID=A0A561U6S6_9PSEU|nr:MCE family protein [Saccharopolyspora dendranthemae]TWF95071.1 phospholipid/cholesterol/gamma-HCH transport system substrate-binding protein [Saccharopolyspora dendranthemae]